MCVCVLSECVLDWLIGAELHRWVHVTRGVQRKSKSSRPCLPDIYCIIGYIINTRVIQFRNFMTSARFACEKDGTFYNSFGA